VKEVIDKLLLGEKPSVEELAYILQASKNESVTIFDTAYRTKLENVGSKVYLRGIIEVSNICRKNCYYCGIRLSNSKIERYTVSEKEVLDAAMFAYENNLGSIVLQSGENTNEKYIKWIEQLIRKIKELSNNQLGITLSLGEQTEETYIRWKEAGAHRYLLRIETSNPDLYKKIHPNNNIHSFENRLNCLYLLKKCNYQVGTGVMIGLPFQSRFDLANDLLFFNELEIDMCGMGPYIEHSNTPLIDYKDLLFSQEERLDLALKMIALLRLMMKDINIAATTALQVVDPYGREKAIMAGANVYMPNITPQKYRGKYFLYENKPCVDDDWHNYISALERRLTEIGHKIGYNEWGDSKHFIRRIKNSDSI